MLQILATVVHRRLVALTLLETYHFSLAGSQRFLSNTSFLLRQQSKPSRHDGGKSPNPKYVQSHAFESKRQPRFSSISKIPRRAIAKKLTATLTGICEDGYISKRLQSLGLSGPILRALRQRLSQNDKSEEPEDDSFTLYLLLRAWVRQRQDRITAELKIEVQSGSTPILTAGMHALAGEQRKGQITLRELQDSPALRRLHVVAFLEWVQVQLRGVIAERILASEVLNGAASMLAALKSVRRNLHLDEPAAMFPSARFLRRQLHLHVGPTNSGKTHGALVRLVNAHSGVYLGPLRLLAHEIWDRINHGRVSSDIPARPCNLRTGEEERKLSKFVALTSATVEMAPLNHLLDVAVIDEIQMIADPQRGAAWTNAVLGIAAKEVHLCGEDVVIPLIETLAKDCGDDLTIHRYQRLTPLTVAENSIDGDLGQIRPGDCVVSFARQNIFALKERIESLKTSDGTPLRCAIAYGHLPPEVKAEQARLFNEGTEFNVMVASDAIGMGLNLRIKRIIFESLYKFNGTEDVVMSAAQIKQIAGRAGRYGTARDGTEDGGVVTCMRKEDMDVLREALEVPNREVRRAAIQPLPESIDELSSCLAPVEIKTEGELAKTVRDFQQRRRTRQRRDTTLDGQTLDVLQAADDILLVDAQGDPDLEQQERELARAARADVRLSNVYTDIAALASVNEQKYFLSDLNQQSIIAPLVRRASSLPAAAGEIRLPAPLTLQGTLSRSTLTMQEIELFATSPANVRDSKLMACLTLFVRQYSRGQRVDFVDAIAKTGLKAALDTADATYHELKQAWSASQTEGESEPPVKVAEPTIQQLALLTDSRPAITAVLLRNLETMHGVITLYQWLSSRFPLAFSYRSVVLSYKERTERAVELSLEVMRSARNKRLAELGRSVGQNAKAEKEERRRQNRANFKYKVRGKGVKVGTRCAVATTPGPDLEQEGTGLGRA